MKISVYIPRPAEHPAEDPDRVPEFASLAERLGYDAIAASDHPFPVVDGRGHQALDPFVVLAHAAAATTRIRLHVNLVVLPYRNPFLLARATASLQFVSRGRLILSVGSGYLEEEFEALGARFEDKREQSVASLHALRAAWTGEPVHDSRPWWRAGGNRLRPPAEPPIPVWFGGNSRWAMERAVLDCDGWAPHEVTATASKRIGSLRVVGVEGLRPRLEVLHELRARHRRTAPLEVCFTRNLPDWMDGSRGAVAAEIRALQEVGVTWLCVRFRPGNADRMARDLASFAALVQGVA